MKINRIKINTKDVWKFGLIALLVDREDFLQDIELSRKKLGIKTLLLRKDVKKEADRADDIVTANKYNKLTTDQKKYFDTSKVKLIASSPYDDTVISLTQKYHRSDSFQEVVKFSILCGEVEDEDLVVPQPMPFSADPKKDISYIPIRHPQIAIIVNPETNPEDVRKYFVESRKFTTSTQNLYHYMSYFTDIKTKIKTHRNWYWQNKKGQTAQEIFSGLNPGYGVSLKSVEAAITKYKKLLNSFRV